MVVSRRGLFGWLPALFDSSQRSQELVLKRPDQKKEASLRRLLPKKDWKPNNAYEVVPATVGTDGSVVGKDGKPIAGWATRTDWNKARIVAYRPDFEGLVQGTFRDSQRYNEPVIKMMAARIPVSLFYGLISAIITYVICIPLGILKAIKHRTILDNTTSLLIFAGYAVPAFVLGSVLAVFLAARFGWFPTGGFVSENFEELSLGGKVWDLIYHGTLPMICYLIGNFAFLTMLMKNSLLDNLAADYVRTAIAKGAGFKTAVFRHALRNSLIPIMTTLGGLVSVFVAGSILIERIFDINGFGMLSYQAILDRDLFLIMGILTVNVFLIMLGNILSDYFVALMDPRIRFD
jgi:microcin C transport system permease protein